MKVSHCNICGAIILFGSDDKDDSMVLLHQQWHEAMFAAIDVGLAKVLHVDKDVIASELNYASSEKSLKAR